MSGEPTDEDNADAERVRLMALRWIGAASGMSPVLISATFEVALICWIRASVIPECRLAFVDHIAEALREALALKPAAPAVDPGPPNPNSPWRG